MFGSAQANLPLLVYRVDPCPIIGSSTGMIPCGREPTAVLSSLTAPWSVPTKANTNMSIAKIIEISSDSDTSFHDAIESGIRRAEKTLKNVKGAWIAEQG
jgi:hypothetical protein